MKKFLCITITLSVLILALVLIYQPTYTPTTPTTKEAPTTQDEDDLISRLQSIKLLNDEIQENLQKVAEQKKNEP